MWPVEKSNQATVKGIGCISLLGGGQLEPGNFNRGASGVILRLLLIAHSTLMECSAFANVVS